MPAVQKLRERVKGGTEGGVVVSEARVRCDGRHDRGGRGGTYALMHVSLNVSMTWEKRVGKCGWSWLVQMQR